MKEETKKELLTVLLFLSREDLWDDDGIIFTAHQKLKKVLESEQVSDSAVNSQLGEVPKCEQKRYWFGKLLFQRLYFTGHWYAIYNGMIIDHDQYRHDLEERLRHFA